MLRLVQKVLWWILSNLEEVIYYGELTAPRGRPYDRCDVATDQVTVQVVEDDR
ncbi:hypothetical protein [Methanopyrus sp.]